MCTLHCSAPGSGRNRRWLPSEAVPSYPTWEIWRVNCAEGHAGKWLLVVHKACLPPERFSLWSALWTGSRVCYLPYKKTCSFSWPSTFTLRHIVCGGLDKHLLSCGAGFRDCYLSLCNSLKDKHSLELWNNLRWKILYSRLKKYGPFSVSSKSCTPSLQPS